MTGPRQERNAWRAALKAVFVCMAIGMYAPWLIRADAATTERVVVDRYTGLAINGFDPVAYFTDARPLPGFAQFEAPAAGVIWRFRNASNRDFFLARPDIYAPQFGGYDPVGVARGVTVAGNVRLWLIADSRLFLFEREDTLRTFKADPERFLREARRQWPALEDQLAQ